MDKLSHIDDKGRPKMVDITAKPDTIREAVAGGIVSMQPATFQMIKQGGVAKGDLLAVAQLADIMDCCGLSEVEDSEELHGKPMLIKVRTRKGSGGYEDQNEIKGFKPAQSAVSMASTTSTAAPAGNKPSWAS